jgi:hypothetical protein
MADPIVGIVNGVPTSGTGNITTLGQTLLDGANATHGALADAAVAAGAAGSFSAKLRAISRDIGSLVTGTVLAAGSALIGIVKIGDGTNTATVKAASTAALATDTALVVAISPNSAGSVAQGSTTSGQTGALIQGAVTTAAPTYTTAQTSPLSLDAAGNLRVGVVPGNTETAATGVTIGTSGVGYLGWLSSIAKLLSGALSVTPTDQYSTHKEVGAGATATVLGATGAIGDYLSHVTIAPGIAACGVVTILDGTNTVLTFAGGSTTALPSLVPFTILIGAVCTGAGWHITTGASVTVTAIGKFT